MGFTEAVKSVFSKYATFSGRASRSEFWYWYLFNIIVTCVYYIILGAQGVNVMAGDGSAAGLGLITVIFWIYSLAVLLPNLAVTVRRLHDTGRSGWNWFFVLIPFVGAIILLVFLVQGSDGDNQSGPVPE